MQDRALIRNRAFGLIELLIVALLVMLLSWKLLDAQRRKIALTAPATGELETALRKDVEGSGKIEILELRPDFISGKNSDGTFQYSVSGTVPHREVIRSGGAQTSTIVSHAISLRFTAFDEDGRYLPDEPSATERNKIYRIRVEVSVHDDKETPSLLISDGIHGVDLDGDPTNGVAMVREKSFGLIIAKTNTEAHP